MVLTITGSKVNEPLDFIAHFPLNVVLELGHERPHAFALPSAVLDPDLVVFPDFVVKEPGPAPILRLCRLLPEGLPTLVDLGCPRERLVGLRPIFQIDFIRPTDIVFYLCVACIRKVPVLVVRPILHVEMDGSLNIGPYLEEGLAFFVCERVVVAMKLPSFFTQFKVRHFPLSHIFN